MLRVLLLTSCSLMALHLQNLMWDARDWTLLTSCKESTLSIVLSLWPLFFVFGSFIFKGLPHCQPPTLISHFILLLHPTFGVNFKSFADARLGDCSYLLVSNFQLSSFELNVFPLRMEVLGNSGPIPGFLLKRIHNGAWVTIYSAEYSKQNWLNVWRARALPPVLSFWS